MVSPLMSSGPPTSGPLAIMSAQQARGPPEPEPWRQNSQAKRPGFGQVAARFHRQGRDGAGAVEPQIGVELAAELDGGIVARKFALGPIDHADEALEPL